MDLSKYEVREEKGREGVYWYYSNGPNGSIRKIVEIQEMQVGHLFNLALGDEIEGKITYSNISDNKDTKKVLATITEVIQQYTSKFHNRWIHITGDTKIKTRLYQIHISNNIREIKAAGYIVLGFREGEEPEEFRVNVTYDGFLVKRS